MPIRVTRAHREEFPVWSPGPKMIRLLLYSQDASLQFLLAPTLGSEFSVVLERRMDRIREIVSRKECDVVLLDLDCSSFPMKQQLGFFDEIRDLAAPVVVMT